MSAFRLRPVSADLCYLAHQIFSHIPRSYLFALSDSCRIVYSLIGYVVVSTTLTCSTPPSTRLSSWSGLLYLYCCPTSRVTSSHTLIDLPGGRPQKKCCHCFATYFAIMWRSLYIIILFMTISRLLEDSQNQRSTLLHFSVGGFVAFLLMISHLPHSIIFFYFFLSLDFITPFQSPTRPLQTSHTYKRKVASFNSSYFVPRFFQPYSLYTLHALLFSPPYLGRDGRSDVQ